MANPDREPAGTRQWGAPTRWSIIRAAAGREPEADVSEAWRFLLDRYREPVRRSLARRLPRHPLDEVADEFFSYLYERELLDAADPDRGRFRCYVQGVLRRFALGYARSSRSAGDTLPQEELLPDVAAERDAESRDESEWAEAYLTRALERLLAEYPRDGELLLHAHGLFGRDELDTAGLCERTGRNRNALYQALFKARKRLRGFLEDEIADTVLEEGDLAQEVNLAVERLIAARPGLFGDGRNGEDGE